MQFYKIELGEQRRLMGVMEHHSKESTTVPASVQSQSYGTISESDEERTEEEDNGEREGGEREHEREREEEAFPFSITAGVEKGTKNRYRNIWPFEHARVRLASRTHLPPPQLRLSPTTVRPTRPRGNSMMLPPTTPDETSDDYVNASYVQPLGTNKRYIATQGPLPETFTDFWT